MLTEDSEDRSITMTRPTLWSTLLFGPFAVALLCYIWAFCSQSHKLSYIREFLVLSCCRRSHELRGAQNIYYASFTLLIFDGFTAILGLVWGILLLCSNFDVVTVIFYNMWLAFRLFSVCQHLITALIAILFVCHPKWGNGLRITSKILHVVPFVFIVLGFRIDDTIFIGVDVFNLLLMLAIVVTCCLPASSSMAKQRSPIGLLAVSFYFFICLPNAVVNCLLVSSDGYFAQVIDVTLFTNFYIFMNGLLFYFVLKIEEEDQRENQYDCAIRSA